MNNASTILSQENAVLLENFFGTLRAHWFLILVVTLMTSTGAYVGLQLTTNQYETVAEILVKPGRENAGVLVTPAEINSEIRLILSRSLIETTIEKMGVERFFGEDPLPETLFQKIKYHLKMLVKQIKYEINEFLIMVNLRKRINDKEQVILMIQDRLVAERARDSDVIRIIFRLPDPLLAVEFVEAHLDLFLDKHIEVRLSNNMQTFFDSNSKVLAEKLSGIEKQRQNVLKKLDISSLDEQRKLLLKRWHDIHAEIDQYQGKLLSLTVMDDFGGEYKGEQSDFVGTGNMTDLEPVEEKLTTLQIQLSAMERKFDSGSRVLEDTKREISFLKQSLVKAFEGRIEKLNKRIYKINSRLQQLNSAEDSLRAIDLQYEIAKNSYTLYASRTEEARISNQMDNNRVSNISMVSAPSFPIKPVYPRKLLIMVLSFPIGLVLGIGIALLIEYLNNTIRSFRDLADIDGLTYLGDFRL